jgi:MHS family alpha-ketoglutarate permease-like MFS transporter
LFPTEVRALGVGLSYAVANAMFGGTAKYVALWLKSTGRESWFAWYVAGMVAIGLAASLLMPDTRKYGYLEGSGQIERCSPQVRTASRRALSRSGNSRPSSSSLLVLS